MIFWWNYNVAVLRSTVDTPNERKMVVRIWVCFPISSLSEKIKCPKLCEYTKYPKLCEKIKHPKQTNSIMRTTYQKANNSKTWKRSESEIENPTVTSENRTYNNPVLITRSASRQNKFDDSEKNGRYRRWRSDT